MTNGLRSPAVRESRGALRIAARAATTTALVVGATVVGFSASSHQGRTVEALGQSVGAGGEYHALDPARILDTRDPAQDVPPFGRKSYSDTAVFDVLRVEGGRIVEHWGVPDRLGALFQLGLAQPQVSKHLRVLREVGAVAVREDGRRRLYRLDGAALKPIHDWVKAYEQLWTDRFAELDVVLDGLE